MIRVNYKNKDNFISEIEIIGHANYADFGKDIVCAAVSSIATTTINSIIALNENAISIENSDGYIKVIVNDNEMASILLNVMLNEFKELANDYPKNIKVGG